MTSSQVRGPAAGCPTCPCLEQRARRPHPPWCAQGPQTPPQVATHACQQAALFGPAFDCVDQQGPVEPSRAASSSDLAALHTVSSTEDVVLDCRTACGGALGRAGLHVQPASWRRPAHALQRLLSSPELDTCARQGPQRSSSSPTLQLAAAARQGSAGQRACPSAAGPIRPCCSHKAGHRRSARSFKHAAWTTGACLAAHGVPPT